jgi:hypothetical protein
VTEVIPEIKASDTQFGLHMATAVLSRMYFKSNDWIPCQSDANKMSRNKILQVSQDFILLN